MAFENTRVLAKTLLQIGYDAEAGIVFVECFDNHNQIAIQKMRTACNEIDFLKM